MVELSPLSSTPLRLSVIVLSVTLLLLPLFTRPVPLLSVILELETVFPLPLTVIPSPLLPETLVLLIVLLLPLTVIPLPLESVTLTSSITASSPVISIPEPSRSLPSLTVTLPKEVPLPTAVIEEPLTAWLDSNVELLTVKLSPSKYTAPPFIDLQSTKLHETISVSSALIYIAAPLLATFPVKVQVSIVKLSPVT